MLWIVFIFIYLSVVQLEHATRKNQVYLAKKRQAKKMEKHRALEMKYRAEAIRLYGDKSNSSVQDQQASS